MSEGDIEMMKTTTTDRIGRLAAFLVVCIVGLLDWASVPALALPPTTIASFGSGAGKVFSPEGVAVAPSGDIYVADNENHRVDEFGPGGEFLLAWGLGVRDGVSQELQTCGPDSLPPAEICFGGVENKIAPPGDVRPASIAVEPSTGGVYVSETGGDGGFRVQKFSASGEFLLMFGGEVNKTAVKDNGSEAEQNLCTREEVEVDHDECGEGTSGTGTGEFGREARGALPIALDSSGNVWVGDTGRLQEFTASGQFLKQVPIAEDPVTKGLAIGPSGDFYLFSESANASFTPGVLVFEASGAPVTVLDGAGKPQALAINSAGDLYVLDKAGEANASQRLLEYDPEGVQIEQFASGAIIGHPYGNALAVDGSAGALYAASSTGSARSPKEEGESVVQRFALPTPGPILVEGSQAAVERTGEAATLTAKLDPEGQATSYRFQYVSEEAFSKEGGFASPQVKETTVAALSDSDFGEYQASARVQGLAQEVRYRFRVVATNHCNASLPAQECTIAGEQEAHGHEVPAAFETLPLAVVEAEWMSEPASSEATFDAQIDPNGSASEYVFQYAMASSYASSGQLAQETTPQHIVAQDPAGLHVFARVLGLGPSTAYDYRVVVRHGARTIMGAVLSFSTQGEGGGLGLPDGRSWELVASSTGGGEIRLPEFGLPQAAESGGALAYLTRAPSGAEVQGNRAPEATVQLASHGGAGWSSKTLTTPYTAAVRVLLHGSDYVMFNRDLTSAVVEPPAALPPAGEDEWTPYLAHLSEKPLSFEPLAPAAHLRSPAEQNGGSSVENILAGGTPDLENLVLGDDKEGTLNGEGVTEGLYEWSSREGLHAVSVLPADEGGAAVAGGLGAHASERFFDVRNAISADGSLVFWYGGRGLYVRDTQADESVRLDVVAGGSGNGAADPVFQDASSDGSRVFFTDTQALTPGAGVDGEDPELYVCRLTVGPGGLSCALSDVTAHAGVGSANVQGVVSAVSEGGTRVYFVATSVLASGAEEGKANLYTASEVEGSWQVRWIATLGADDSQVWGGFKGFNVQTASEPHEGEIESMPAEGSPDGRYFAFMSSTGLTGYDNHDAISGEPDAEVYLYDAQSARLACVSCDPTGARPHGAAGVPAWNAPHGLGHGQNFYQPQYLFDSGRLFFETATALVPGDGNGVTDVYEYEPPHGAETSSDDTCTAGAETYHASIAGCVDLISSGSSGGESLFLDASGNGNDVFFLSKMGVNGEAGNGTYSIFDAHACGAEGGWSCSEGAAAVPPPCTTTSSCRGAPSPQPTIFGGSGSATFSGPGNSGPPSTSKPARIVKKKAAIVKCAGGKRRRKGRCVRVKKNVKRVKALRSRKSAHGHGRGV